MLELYSKEKEHLPSISEEELSDAEVLEQTWALKEKLASKVLVLGHHYQQDDVVQFADVVGDSLQLAKYAAEQATRPYIIFCGVHFMAETADMLTKNEQQVILPDMRAGCSMADMAVEEEIRKGWNRIEQASDATIVPITYINCAASLKAFVGEHGGSICTSSNAKQIIQWALTQGEKLLFFPDQHLGRNTCFELGITLDEMQIYDPRKWKGGLTDEQIRKAKVLLWYGYCSVHQGFSAQQVKKIKEQEPDRTVIVHPECSFDVVQASDKAGSTSFIIKQIEQAKDGEKFAIGTEINLVNRLAQKHKHLDIKSLSPYQCLCTTMYRVRPRWLLESFRSIERDSPVNVIKVDEKTTHYSMKALERMLEIS